jgi:hypothetical protein
MLVLRMQPPDTLDILARVLPLGVFWERPEALVRRASLPRHERRAVEGFRADYNAYCHDHFAEQVTRVTQADDPKVLERFKTASRKGKEMVEQIADQWACNPAHAGPGEWGLLSQREGLRIAVSLNLGRNMSLSYHISMFDVAGSRTIRFHDDYLSVLGLGTGSWAVRPVDHFPDKLLRTSEFARWHVEEYEKLLRLAP